MESKKIKIEVSAAELEKIEGAVAGATATFLEGLPQLVRSRLEGAVAKILGFENSWGGSEWRVDHCNGRQSVMSEYISQQGRNAAASAVSTIATAAINELNKNSKLHEAIKMEFANIFERELKSQLQEHARKTVAEMLKKASDTHTIEIETLDHIPTRREVADPNFGKKPMERLIAETIIKSGAPLGE